MGCGSSSAKNLQIKNQIPILPERTIILGQLITKFFSNSKLQVTTPITANEIKSPKSQYHTQEISQTKEELIDILKNDYSTGIITIFRSNDNIITFKLDLDNKTLFIKRTIFTSKQEAGNFIQMLFQLNRYSFPHYEPFVTIDIFQSQGLISIDRSFNKYEHTFEQRYTEKAKNIQTLDSLFWMLDVLAQVTECLSAMHDQHLHYQLLRPTNIFFINENVFLANPSPHWTDNELALFQNYTPEQYDIICTGALVLYILNGELSFDEILEKRTKQSEWNKFIEKIFVQLEEKFKDVQPTLMIQYIKYMNEWELYKMPCIKWVHQYSFNLLKKSQQTGLKNDSLSSFLMNHSNQQLQTLHTKIHFIRKNQMHIFDISTKEFHIVKAYKKKKRYLLDQGAIYFPYDEHLYFFNHQAPYRLQQLFLSEGSDKSSIVLRREMEVFKSFKNVELFNPSIVYVPRSSTESCIYIMNRKKRQNPQNGNYFYDSFIMSYNIVEDDHILDEQMGDIHEINKYLARIEQEQKRHNKEKTYKTEVKIMEGPWLYQTEEFVFFFYDWHNKILYGLKESQNMFKSGILYYYYDTDQREGNFHQGALKFACYNEEIYKKFSELNISLKNFKSITEVQHGVFLLLTSSNLIIIDFNFNCFYSFATYQQLKNYQKNSEEMPNLHSHAFLIRNQPFDIKHPTNLITHQDYIMFQKGHLHMLCRIEIETVHCTYKMLSDQGCLEMIHCYSLQSGKDLLNTIPYDIGITYNYIMSKQMSYSLNFVKEINQYKFLKQIHQGNNYIYWTAKDLSGIKYDIYQIDCKSIEKAGKLLKLMLKQLPQDIIVIPIDFFLVENNFIIECYIVFEKYANTLNQEIKERKNRNEPFSPFDIAFILKILIKQLNYTQQSGYSHGFIRTTQIWFSKDGFIKLNGWFLEETSNDLSGCLQVLNNMINMNGGDDEVLDLSGLNNVNISTEKFNNVLLFIKKWQNVTDYQNKVNQLKNEMQILHTSLMQMKFDARITKSNNNLVFWIGYGSDYIISCDPLQGLFGFVRNTIRMPNGQYFKFSKYNMFAYNNEMLYLSNAFRDEVKNQTFFKIILNFQQDSIIKMQKLADFPDALIQPTLLYANNGVYSFGGYILKQNLAKEITSRVLLYIEDKNIWVNKKNLPFSLVNSTALFCKKSNKVYLFGGISNEIDLKTSYLCFLVYDIKQDQWDFCFDFSFRSPFINSRFNKPMVDLISPEVFLCLRMDKTYFYVDIFDLTKGGVNIKLQVQYQDQKSPSPIRNVVEDIYNKGRKNEYEKVLQDDLSISVQSGVLYFLDEETRDLRVINFLNLLHPVFDTITFNFNDRDHVDQH